MNNKLLSILIIDDEADIREIIRERILAELPEVKCFEAKDGIEGLHKISIQQFDLVITDLGLPKIDGQTVIREARSLPKAFVPKRFIVITGNTDPGTHPSRLGSIEFFSKPIQWDQFLSSIKGVNEAPPPKRSIDVEFINPFIDSALLVLQITAGMKATRQKITLKESSQACIGDISGIISMNSQTYLGSMAITFEESCFLAIVNAMLGETYTSINDENRDAASELCNQIFGGAKKVLNQKGHTIQPAIPSVITGKSHQIRHSVQGPVIVVQFTTDSGSFAIEAAIEARTH